MIFDDSFDPREVTHIGVSAEHPLIIGIYTATGWCSIGFFIKEYSRIPTNANLTAYLVQHYPEYFI